ncbi:MAG: YebC/PmpR family DNA-binding transcriptional regulator [Helicobacter sp.]|nr:YebC/PmpR family DNA-binding transcriptional regulator [Helicobacter sp.]
MGRAFEYRRAAKERRWDKMSKLFPKLGKMITLAAKEGGSDPEMNAKLRTAIATAKMQNMPKDNIDAAIKRASGKDGAVISEINYEAKASHGALLFIECATDNPTRTVANIKSYLNKHNGQLLQNGSLEFMFSRKAVFEIPTANIAIPLDELELALIDYGLDSLENEGENVFVYGDYVDFGRLTEGLESLQIVPSKASLQRIPNQPATYTAEQLEDIEKLLDKIEDDDDVQAVYTNIA